MVKKGVYIKKTRIPTFRTSLWIIVSDRLQKSIDAIQDITTLVIDCKSIDAYVYAYTQDNGAYRILLFIQSDSRHGRIAHEALHSVNIAHLWHGQRPSYSNDEFQAYQLDCVVEEIYAAIKYYEKKVARTVV